MAMGADRAILVDVPEKPDQAGLEPLTVAKLLKNVVQKENINLVLLGKQAIDGDQGQTGQMLAGLLGWSQATQASKVVVKDDAGNVEVTREVDGGVETLKAKLPMVITTDLRLNEPRYASLPNIMKAKRKPLEKKTLADFEIEDKKRLKVLKVTGMWRIPFPLPFRLFSVLVSLLDKANLLFNRTPHPTRRRKGRGRRWNDRQTERARCPMKKKFPSRSLPLALPSPLVSTYNSASIWCNVFYFIFSPSSFSVSFDI